MLRMMCLALVLAQSIVFAESTASLNAETKQDNKAFLHDRERGWYWYEDPELVEEEPEEEKVEEPKVSTVVMTPREILKKQGEDWEDAMAQAVLEPTRENVTRYLALTDQIQGQAQNFAKSFKQTIWVTPEYDYTLQRPVSTQAIVARNQQQNRMDDQKLFQIAENNGIIFFFRSDCPHCHRFAPILKRFSEQYKFTVIPVSLDGGSLPEYPYPKKNYDLGRKLNVSVVPAVFLVEPETNTVSTVGYGYSDWSTLAMKILNAANQMYGGQNLAQREGL